VSRLFRLFAKSCDTWWHRTFHDCTLRKTLRAYFYRSTLSPFAFDVALAWKIKRANHEQAREEITTIRIRSRSCVSHPLCVITLSRHHSLTSSTPSIATKAVTKTSANPSKTPFTRVLSLQLTRARIVRFSYLCTVFLVSPGFVCTRREGRQWPLSNTKTFATRPRRWPLSKDPFSSPPTGERYESNMQSQKWPRWALQISGSK